MKKIVFVFLVVMLGVSCLQPPFPDQMILQHIGTVLLLLPLAIDLKRNDYSRAAFVGLSLFVLIHIVGARYIYSYVPYADWFNSIGIDINQSMDWERNHYDRFTHFSFGLLLFPIICETVFLRFKINKIGSILLAWALIQTGSMVYELFEWTISLLMSPEDVESYNGQQGDMWDAHKDMALALVGSSITAFIYWVKFRK